MFYTREEQTKRTGYWCKYRSGFASARRLLISVLNSVLMNGFAIIFLGFVAFGLLHTRVGIVDLLHPRF